MHADFIKISEIPALERVLKDRFNGQPPLQVLASNQIEAFLAQQPSRFHGLLDSDNTELLKNDVAIPPRIGKQPFLKTTVRGYTCNIAIALFKDYSANDVAEFLASGEALFHTSGTFRIAALIALTGLHYGLPQRTAASGALPLAQQLFLFLPSGKKDVREIATGCRGFHITKTYKVLCSNDSEKAEEMAEGTSVLIFRDVKRRLAPSTKFSRSYNFGAWGRINPNTDLTSEEAFKLALQELATGRDLFWRADGMGGGKACRLFSLDQWLKGVEEMKTISVGEVLRNVGYPTELKSIRDATVAKDLELVGVIDLIYSDSEAKAELTKKIKRADEMDAEFFGGITI